MQCEKTVIHIPKLRAGQYLILFDISYYLKISLTKKKRNAKNLKIKFRQRQVKPKFSIDKKTKILPILYQFYHQNLNVGMYFYLSAIISRKKFAIVNLILIT